jgi:hypothetical protein
MKINDIINEDQLDELSLKGIGQGIGKGIGAASKGLGAGVGGLVGAWNAAKQGYEAGKKAVTNLGQVDSASTSTNTSTDTGTVGVGTASTGTGTTTTPAAGGTAPTGTGTTPPSTGTGTTTTPAASGTAPAPTGTGTTTTPAGSRTSTASSGAAARAQASSDPYTTFKQQMRGQTAPKPGAKPLPQKFVDTMKNDLAIFAKGSKDYGVNIADRLMKFANQGYDVSQLANQWNANSKLVDRMREGFLYTAEYQQLCELLTEHNVSLSSLGLRVRIVESVTDGVFIGYKSKSSSFDVVFD